MFGHHCFGVVVENTCGERLKRLATQIAFSDLHKGLQILKYNKCAADIFFEKKLFKSKTSQEFENELFLKIITDILNHLNNISNAYDNGQTLSKILDSIHPINKVEQVEEPLVFTNIKEPSESIIFSTRKKVDNPFQLWIENDYLMRHREMEVSLAMIQSEKVEQDLLNEIKKLKTLISYENRCFQNINQTQFQACKSFKERFEEKNQEYEDDFIFYEQEITGKKNLIDKMKNQRQLLNSEIVRFHDEIKRVQQKIKTQTSVPIPVSRYEVKPSSQKLTSKFENMKNLQNKKFRVNAKQTIKGNQIRKVLNMDTKETF